MKIKVKLARWILKTAGFTIDYNVPPQSHKCVLVFAPHTSKWDFVVGKLAFIGMQIDIKFFIKKESFGLISGFFLKKLGGIPVDRQHVKKLPVHVGEMIKQKERMSVLIAPEGTRKRVDTWKKGFYFIAQYAQVPMCLGYLDWSTKKGGIGPVMYPTGDYDADLIKIEDFYRGMKGKHEDQFNL